MVACFRQGSVVLPCTEQLRAKDLRLRLDGRATDAGRRRRAQRAAELRGGWSGPTIWVPGVGDERRTRTPPPAAELDREDPCLITFTSGTAGEPKAVVHAQRYLAGQQLQAEHWLDARPGELVWCTAASGWSKSARNVFIAPVAARRRGAAARRALRPARAPGADPGARARRRAVHGADRVPRDRQARRAAPAARRCAGLVAAGEALNPEVLRAWHEATGLWIRDGYGQTETGQLTGDAAGRARRGPARWAGRCRASTLWVDDGELVARPGDRADVLPAATSATTRRTTGAVAHRRPRRPRTTTASCTSRAAPTT